MGFRIIFIKNSIIFQNIQPSRNSVIFLNFVFHVKSVFQIFIEYFCGWFGISASSRLFFW